MLTILTACHFFMFSIKDNKTVYKIRLKSKTAS